MNVLLAVPTFLRAHRRFGLPISIFLLPLAGADGMCSVVVALSEIRHFHDITVRSLDKICRCHKLYISKKRHYIEGTAY